MEKITGMKITREREGKKMYDAPKELDFYNDEGEIVLSIHITPHTKEAYIFPHGVEITMVEGILPLRKHSIKGVNYIGNNPLGDCELIFKEEG